MIRTPGVVRDVWILPLSAYTVYDCWRNSTRPRAPTHFSFGGFDYESPVDHVGSIGFDATFICAPTTILRFSSFDCGAPFALSIDYNSADCLATHSASGP